MTAFGGFNRYSGQRPTTSGSPCLPSSSSSSPTPTPQIAPSIVLPMPSALARRVWDPGIDPGAEMLLAPTAPPFDMAIPSTRFHGVDSFVDCSFYLPTSHSNVVVVTMVRTNRSMLPRLRQQWDPGSANLLAGPKNPTTSFFYCSHFRHPPLDICNSSSATSLRRNECRGAPRPMAVRMMTVQRGALALIQSLFQYSHPVLSRPTVPNIQ